MKDIGPSGKLASLVESVKNLLTMLPLLAALTSCGGGSGSSDGPIGGPAPDPPPPPDPDPVADRFEPNDTAAAATIVTLPMNETGLTIHGGGDEDFFQFELTATTDVQIVIRFLHDSGDLDLELIDAAGTRIEFSGSSTDDETVTGFALPADVYAARVFGHQGAMTDDYGITIETVDTPPAALSELFGDITVFGLSSPQVFGSGSDQTLALASELLNVGTAPAPGDDLGEGTAHFRLRDAGGRIIASGKKGPIFFTDNGGCDARRDIHDAWIARGMPHIEGTEGARSLTSPGCIDFYSASTNNDLDTPLTIGDPAVVPDGDYFYELEFDTPGIYDFEPAFARANNRGAVPISISSNGNQRLVTVTGPIIRSGETAVNAGTMTTIVGNGAALANLPPTFGNDSGIGPVWGVARNSAGELFYTLFDDGAFCRDNGGGSSTKIVEGLDRPMVFDFFDNDDVVIAEFGSNRILLATAAGAYGDAAPLAFSGFTINAPTSVRVGPDGLAYVSNSGNHEILSLDVSSGETRRIAGTGIQGFSGDGQAAVDARLSYPVDVDISAEGLMVIADAHNNRLRIVNLNATENLSLGGIELLPGQINTLAGSGAGSLAGDIFDNGAGGFHGERQHARAAILDWPAAPRVAEHRVFFVDADNHRLRVIDEFGTIHLLAGNTPLPEGNGSGTPGSENIDVGDGGSGLDATLNRPRAIYVDVGPDSSVGIDISDSDHYRIRKQNDVMLMVTPYLE